MTEATPQGIGRLLVVSGNVEMQEPLTLVAGSTITFGRTPMATVCIPQDSIARRQCDLEVRGESAFLIDYGFTRGPQFGNRVAINGRLLSTVDNFWQSRPWPIPNEELENVVNDLGGLFERLKVHELNDGDEIQVGDALFRIELQSRPKTDS